jgi:hypothetical protein
MKKTKNNRTIILVVILLGLLILAYKVMFGSTSSSEEAIIDENVIASQNVESILQELQSINFDMSVTQNTSFNSLRSIETPIISLPVGRSNPFSPTTNTKSN